MGGLLELIAPLWLHSGLELFLLHVSAVVLAVVRVVGAALKAGRWYLLEKPTQSHSRESKA